MNKSMSLKKKCDRRLNVNYFENDLNIACATHVDALKVDTLLSKIYGLM